MKRISVILGLTLVCLVGFFVPLAFAEDSSGTPIAAITDVTLSPNPFSPNGDGLEDVTAIAFKLDQKANVKITISNYKGVVKLLWNNFTKEADDYTASWTGTDNSGHVLPNGNYKYTITAANSFGTTIYS